MLGPVESFFLYLFFFSQFFPFLFFFPSFSDHLPKRQVSKVPKFDVLVGQLAFRLQFAEMYNDSEKRVSAVSSALSDMKMFLFLSFFLFLSIFLVLIFTNRKTELHTLLKIILDVGNTLNERTCYGEAKGFRLSSLRKLRDAKSTTQPRVGVFRFRLLLFYYLVHSSISFP